MIAVGKDRPVPPGGDTGRSANKNRKFPFKTLEVGESFFAAGEKAPAGAVAYYQNLLGHRYAVRREIGHRITRVS